MPGMPLRSCSLYAGQRGSNPLPYQLTPVKMLNSKADMSIRDNGIALVRKFSALVTKQLFPCHCDVYRYTHAGIARLSAYWPLDTIGNLFDCISFPLDSSLELAFGCKLSVGSAFRVTRKLLVGHVGVGLSDGHL